MVEVKVTAVKVTPMGVAEVEVMAATVAATATPKAVGVAEVTAAMEGTR